MILKSVTTALAMLALASANAAMAGEAKGNITLGAATMQITQVFLVTGPDEFDPSKSISRLYLTNTDLGAKLAGCTTLACADAAMGDGAMVDYGAASHLAYAVRLDGQMKQYSGSTDASAFELTTDAPAHLAGTLAIDDSAMGGAKVDAEFDASLAKAFDQAR
jgi:hypothetical protein